MKKIISKDSTFGGRYLTLNNFENQTFARVQSLATELSIQLDGDKHELTFDLNHDLAPLISVFYGRDHFLAEHSYARYKNDFDLKTIVVFLEDGKLISKDPGDEYTNENALITNYIQYRNIFSAMLANSAFVSVHSPEAKQIIILSVKYGSYNIGYKLAENRVESLSNLKPVYDELVKHLDKVEYVNFFKDVVIDGTHTKQTQDVFWELITGLGAFLFSADRDYQIYVQTFGFDKIKSKFKEEKIKYFESLEKNIESLNKQVAAFPLTFAASAFAGFQVKDNTWILIVITVAYGLYTWVAWSILEITKFNILTTKNDVEKESNKLEKSYKIVYEEFTEDFKNIREKISKIETLHFRLKTVLIALLFVFTIFAITYGSVITFQANQVQKAKEDSIKNIKQIPGAKMQPDSSLIKIDSKTKHTKQDIGKDSSKVDSSLSHN